MKLFHFILVYIMLGSPGPVSKGLASRQTEGGCGEFVSGSKEASHHTLVITVSKLSGKKCVVGEGVGVGLHNLQKAKRTLG